MSIKQQIDQLRKELNEHNYNYYVLDNATISDYEFDIKLKELQDLDNHYEELYAKADAANQSDKDIIIAHQKDIAAIEEKYRLEELEKMKAAEAEALKLKLAAEAELQAKIEELDEAKAAINHLRSELNEVNLLNAKLLYVNKIFNAKNLNESQKLKVVKAFDKAESAREAKLVYESLSEAFVVPVKAGKTQLKESLGFASKAAGIAPKKVIVESNDVISRMQKLANIK